MGARMYGPTMHVATLLPHPIGSIHSFEVFTEKLAFHCYTAKPGIGQAGL